ncbi:hypothetical protein [Streptacidiphilus sp. P02-A3a]|uniref:hypothetical protein n=1 Tax=Streptacidiphilus sp. P02-A3a TaxID=2704468 RepID=UPI0015F92FB6|nr:hypothetical protein [Streptacidiphilus sp. P02-A3a]QMU70055.1 hypothetical protein GXP74_19300 [Streptacidiphilus sp. P02-A3a]
MLGEEEGGAVQRLVGLVEVHGPGVFQALAGETRAGRLAELTTGVLDAPAMAAAAQAFAHLRAALERDQVGTPTG